MPENTTPIHPAIARLLDTMNLGGPRIHDGIGLWPVLGPSRPECRCMMGRMASSQWWATGSRGSISFRGPKPTPASTGGWSKATPWTSWCESVAGQASRRIRRRPLVSLRRPAGPKNQSTNPRGGEPTTGSASAGGTVPRCGSMTLLCTSPSSAIGALERVITRRSRRCAGGAGGSVSVRGRLPTPGITPASDS